MVRIIVKTAEGIAQRYDIEFESIGCDGDHIHILCSAHPKVSPGQVVRVFKSIAAREVFRRKPGVKKELWAESSTKPLSRSAGKSEDPRLEVLL
ncbi:MAG: transposase [Gammaproteobacteria bacterium]